MKLKQNSRRHFVGLGLFVAGVVLGCAQSVTAQWSPIANPTPTPGTNIYYNSGNVGIGTTSPSTILHIESSNPVITIKDGTNSGFSQLGRLKFIDSANTERLGMGLIGDGSGDAEFKLSNDKKIRFYTNAVERMTIDGRNVGIGTTSPANLLHILGSPSSAAIVQIRNQNTTSGTSFGMFVAGGTNSSDYALAVRDANDYDLLRVRGDGNVGIGTVSPGQKLEVTGGFRIAGAATLSAALPSGVFSFESPVLREFVGDGSGWSRTFSRRASNTTTDLMTILDTGNVGIGTTTPSSKLSVTGVIASLGNADLPGTVGGQIDITGGYSSPDSGRLIFGDGSGWKMYFSKRSGGTTSDLVTFHDNGNVDVTGNINASGTINAKYQDVAEWVESAEQLAAGTVVVLDSTKPNQVTSSSVSYDTRVAGVISAQPGIALGEKSDSKVLVATTGRVKVKVDASKSPIHIGDLLVTSQVPGVAMKSEPVEFAGRKMHMPGTLIGKALEPLEKGSGEILVLLSLQ